MTRRFSTDPIMNAALLEDAEKLEALGQDAGPTLQELELYEGIMCEACEIEQAVVTDVNGIDLCRACADGCKLPEVQA